TSRGCEAGRAAARWCGGADAPRDDAEPLLLLHVVWRGRGGLARRRAPIHHAQPAVRFLEPHSKIQWFALEEIGDLLKRLLAEILHLQDLTLGLAHQVAERPDIRVLQRV